jgi:DNA-binding transcriptional regulator YiaG
VTHDGHCLVVSIEALPVDRCSRCGEVYFTNESSDQISAAVRAQLGLLQKEEILQRASELGISHNALSNQLGVSLETINAWIDGLLIQSRAMDNLMRVFFAYPQVRESLVAGGPSPLLGLAPEEAGARTVTSATT